MKKILVILILSLISIQSNAAWYLWGQLDNSNSWTYKELIYNSENNTYDIDTYISGYFMITSMNTWNYNDYSNLLLNPIFTSTTFVSNNYGNAQFRLGYNRYYPVYPIQYLEQTFMLLEPTPNYYRVSFIANTNPKCIGLQQISGIIEINKDSITTSNTVIYTINGLRIYDNIENLKGLYIINNKKIILK